MNKINKDFIFKDNPRKITDRQLSRLESDLRKFGDLSGVVYCRNNKAYVGGNQRSKIFDGSQITIIKEYDVPLHDKTVAIGFIEWNGSRYLYREVEFSESEFREACIVANNDGGDWDFDLLQEWDMDELASWDFDTSFFNEGSSDGETKKQEARKSLQERFVVPPFSVLDTRQGYWQDRKRKWLDLGIKSDESRESLKAEGSFAHSIPKYYSYKEDKERELGRKLTHREFSENYLVEYIRLSNSILKRTDSGAVLSVFDPVLCEVMYRWFCVSGGQIFDPFAGGSVRGIVAGMLGYGYLGIDLRKEQVEANERQKQEIAPNADIQWVTGNSINTSEICGGIKVDFVFSCPPYFDLEVYSDDEEDLSNMSWDNFSEQYGEIIRQSVDMLKDNSFACFVVGEVRDKKTGYYRKLVNETVNAFERAGASFYNELTLVNVVGSIGVSAANTFKSRKISKCHQNVLVFYKGDTKKIKSKFPDSDFSAGDFNSESLTQ